MNICLFSVLFNQVEYIKLSVELKLAECVVYEKGDHEIEKDTFLDSSHIEWMLGRGLEVTVWREIRLTCNFGSMYHSLLCIWVGTLHIYVRFLFF